jgi:hypothetical protein
VTEPVRRVRVTTPPPARRGAPTTRGIALPGAPIDEAEAVYARALRTSQLRLALGTVAGFVVVMVALTLVITFVPELDTVALWGVPLSWLLHAFAFYPVIVLFAVLYVRGAARNERRYLALRERE